MADAPKPQPSSDPAPPESAEPHAGTLPEPAVPEEAREFLTGLRENAQPIILGISLALLVFLGVYGYRWYRDSRQQRAAALYEVAQSPADWGRIVEEYPGTKIAPLALLGQAAGLYEEGRFADAEAAYRRFLVDYPHHDLHSSAELGIAYCLEGQNRFLDSAQAYQAFTEANPDHFQAPLAVFGRGRSLEQAGQLEDARIVYEDYLASEPGSQMAARAESALRYVDKLKRAAENPAPAPPELPVAPVVEPPAEPAPVVEPPAEPAPAN